MHASEGKFDVDSAFASVMLAAQDAAPVSGLTHNFYRYPARFSPKLVRSIIEEFSEPGDLVADPFMGGGTTLVEALATGREAIGCDISALAFFLAKAKTTIYTHGEIECIEHWKSEAKANINMHLCSISSPLYKKGGYYRHLNTRTRWRHRKAIEQALSTTSFIRYPKAQALARCIILRTAQWALDSRKNLPSINEFRTALGVYADEIVGGAWELRRAVEALPKGGRMPTHCVKGSVVEIAKYFQVRHLRKPKLIITSPPYPGIHVLYHRWQVDGRKETPAPFWIVNKLDGAGSSYYTMGDRKYPALATYFTQLRAALISIASICDQDTTIVQVVGFSAPSWQLPEYLAVNKAAGLAEVAPPSGSGLSGLREGRLWRSVPNRKWHADQLGEIPASQEVVLFHRRA
jgi:hypothetical protein